MPKNPDSPYQNRPARERILLTAHDLFYRDGIRATGIDKIIAESGVTKVTFYRHFPSKNDLIRAFLDYRHERWMAWFQEALARHGATPGGGLSAILPALGEWFSSPMFRGCAFINSVAELGGASSDVMEISRRHKQDMAEVIAQLLPDSSLRLELANAAAIAIDGAIFKAQLDNQTESAAGAALKGLALLLQGLAAANM